MNKWNTAILSTMLIVNFAFTPAYASIEGFAFEDDEQEQSDDMKEYIKDISPMYNKLKKAILAEDANTIGKLIEYPMEFYVQNRLMHFESFSDFKKANISFDDLFSADTKKLLISEVKNQPCCSPVAENGAAINEFIFFEPNGIYAIHNKNKDNSATTEFFKENHMQGCNEYNAEINYFSQIGLINLFSDPAVMSENQIFEFDNYKVVYKAGSTVPTQLFKNGQNIKLNRVTYSTNQVPIFKTEIGTIAFILEGNDSFERGPSIDRVTFFINFENNDSCVRGELSTYNKNLRRY